MNFSQALELLKQGKNLKRRMWDKNCYMFIPEDIHCICVQHFVNFPGGRIRTEKTDVDAISMQDILADDWMEVKE